MPTLRPRDDPRTHKAIQIAQASHLWHRLTTRDGELVYAIPSQTTPHLYYLTSETDCTCLDHQHNGLHAGRIGRIGLHCLCKHIRAVALVRMQAEAATEGLVLEQLPSGSYAWLRRP
jgi:hypothetical protein